MDPVNSELGLGELRHTTVAWDGEGHATSKNAIHDSEKNDRLEVFFSKKL